MRIRASFADDGRSVTLTPPGGSSVTLSKLDAYVRRDVRIQSADVVLAGTLRVPRDPARRPAALIIQGSNQQVRGGQWGFNGFVADAFARTGFVVLNCDKRGVGDSTGTWDDHYDHLTDDAVTAVKWLRAQPEVDADRVGA
jgi:predicted acyl esterase